jgi:SAM-dependent methyltransferase
MRRHRVRNALCAEIISRRLERGKVLDVGAGRGGLSHRLLELGYDVTAVDVDPSVCEHPDVIVQPCNIMAGLPFDDESFDLVAMTEVIEHVEDPFRAVRECNRVLKPGGLLLLTTPNYGQIEERLGYLTAGTLPGALECRLLPPRPGRAHGHVAPFSIMRLKYLLSSNGFQMVYLTTCIPKRRSWILAPLAGVVWLIAYVFYSRRRRERYHIADQMKTILGGRGLVTLSRKALGPDDTAGA